MANLLKPSAAAIALTIATEQYLATVHEVRDTLRRDPRAVLTRATLNALSKAYSKVASAHWELEQVTNTD